jgi:hypothetical protein
MTKIGLATRLIAAAAMVLPIAVLTLLAVFSPSVPGYDPLWSYISVLTLGSSGWIGILFFALGALTLVTFASSLYRALPQSRDTRTATAFFLLSATCVVMLIFVNIDHVEGVWTLKRAVHWTFVGLAGISFAAGGYRATLSMRASQKWGGVYRFTLVLTSLAAIAATVLSIMFHEGLVALLERLLLGCIAVWIEVISARILQLSMVGAQPREAG